MSDPTDLSESNKLGNSDKDSAHDHKDAHWEEVATTAGITQAQILVGRLKSEGIPARAWQESFGQATGLIFGSLGTGHVLVPEAYVDQALDILDDVNELIDESDYDHLDE